MDNNFLFFMGVCALQVTLACESIVLYMCEGKVLMDKNFCTWPILGLALKTLNCGKNSVHITGHA